MTIVSFSLLLYRNFYIDSETEATFKVKKEMIQSGNDFRKRGIAKS